VAIFVVCDMTVLHWRQHSWLVLALVLQAQANRVSGYRLLGSAQEEHKKSSLGQSAHDKMPGDGRVGQIKDDLIPEDGQSPLAKYTRGRLKAISQGDEINATAATEKQITFIRHGESLGNLLGSKPVLYALETKGSPTAWKDGRLSETGKQASIDRVNEFDQELVDRILDADVVLVSPLIRAMETCMFVLSTAIKRVEAVPNDNVFDRRLKLMHVKFFVMSDLREKYSSDSDKPGSSSVNVYEHLMNTAESLDEKAGGAQTDLLQYVALNLAMSYDEESRSDGWLDDPDDAEKFLAAVTRFRRSLAAMPDKNVLIVGHNGWSRWTFAAGLNEACPKNENEEARDQWFLNVAFGGREVQELANVGVITSKFSDNKFKDAKVYTDGKKCKTKFALFSSLAEAKDEGLIPEDASVHRMLTKKKMDSFGYQTRWVTFSAYGSHSMLAWSSSMAEPKKFIDFVLAKGLSTLQFACDVTNQAVLISSSVKSLPALAIHDLRISNVKPFHLQADSVVEFKQLCLLMQIHAKFGGDAKFIADIFNEIGWDEFITEAELDVHLERSLKAWEVKWHSIEPGFAHYLPNGTAIPAVQEITDPDELEELRHDTGVATSKFPSHTVHSETMAHYLANH